MKTAVCIAGLMFVIIAFCLGAAMTMGVKQTLPSRLPTSQVLSDLSSRTVEYRGGQRWCFKPDEQVSFSLLGISYVGPYQFVAAIQIRAVGDDEVLEGRCLLHYYRVGEEWYLDRITGVDVLSSEP